ncbi:uncharacterized protein LOC130807282 [Amaranthus tricolor]|uniref:uncharacterized protein LOC130807282 n=1 Tax=Amaranthus tricolor TaxID=29722 RepID=UPI002588B866|nr:uncharacterized protein LOC130807282 [Amaranthus tricolor]
MDESILGKRKKRSNFVSRIEVGLQVNEALDPQPRQTITRKEVEQVNGDEIDRNTATSKIKGRSKRGMYKSYVVDMKIKGRGSKLKITIPDEIDRAIGENARHLVNDFGRVVRTKAPLNVKSWKEAFEAAGESMLKEIQEKFEIDKSSDYF